MENLSNEKNDENIIVVKSKDFALRIIKLYKYLTVFQKEFILSKQILRSGTSIGANVKEGIRGQTEPDFYAKMNIALKEASETEYWLELLHESGFLSEHEDDYESLYNGCQELLKILMAITKTQNKQRR